MWESLFSLFFMFNFFWVYNYLDLEVQWFGAGVLFFFLPFDVFGNFWDQVFWIEKKLVGSDQPQRLVDLSTLWRTERWVEQNGTGELFFGTGEFSWIFHTSTWQEGLLLIKLLDIMLCVKKTPIISFIHMDIYIYMHLECSIGWPSVKCPISLRVEFSCRVVEDIERKVSEAWKGAMFLFFLAQNLNQSCHPQELRR